MCGIYGTIRKGRSKVDLGVLRALTLANKERGEESLGFFNSEAAVYKRGFNPIDVLQYEDCSNWLEQSERCWFIVGHTRFSTRGIVCNENSHPFVYGDVVGSHNGIIQAPKEYDVDSMYAIDLLNKFESDYQKAFEGEWGYWTLSWYDRRTDRLYLSMYDNTCGIAFYRGAWYFSSDSDHLAAACGAKEVIELNSGDTVSFDSNGRMTWHQKFESLYTKSYKKDRRTSGGSGSTSYYGNYSGSGSNSYYGNYSGSGSATSKNGQGSSVGWPESNTRFSVNDPNAYVKDYDAEFREIWAEYVNDYS